MDHNIAAGGRNAAYCDRKMIARPIPCEWADWFSNVSTTSFPDRSLFTIGGLIICVRGVEKFRFVHILR
jgi:hypothetical protein